VEAMYSAYVVLVSVAPSAVPVLLYRISSVPDQFKNRPQKHRGGGDTPPYISHRTVQYFKKTRPGGWGDPGHSHKHTDSHTGQQKRKRRTIFNGLRIPSTCPFPRPPATL
jgi:hypothetical protein